PMQTDVVGAADAVLGEELANLLRVEGHAPAGRQKLLEDFDVLALFIGHLGGARVPAAQPEHRRANAGNRQKPASIHSAPLHQSSSAAHGRDRSSTAITLCCVRKTIMFR